MQTIDPKHGRPPSLLAINDALSAPFDAQDLEATLVRSIAGAAPRVHVVESLGPCPECGDEACDHRPNVLARADKALMALSESDGPVMLAGAGSSAAVALLLASRQPALVRGIVLVRPRLGIGAPRESLFARLMRRLAWPCCVLIGTEPPLRPEAEPGTGARLADLGQRLRSIAQPTLIVHARGRRCDDFDDAWLLQRELAGMVEMVTIPDGEGRRSNLGELGLARLQSFVARVASELPRAARPEPATSEATSSRGRGGLAWANGQS